MNASTPHSSPYSTTSLPWHPTWPAREDVGPGWLPLAAEADRLLRSCGIAFDGDVRFRNFYGCLWIDVSYCTAAARKALRRQLPMLAKLRARSREICEVCGQPGKTTPHSEGWVTTLCPKHHAARRDGATWDELMGYRPLNTPSADRVRGAFRPARANTAAAAPSPADEGAPETLRALVLRWRVLADELAHLVPEAAEAYRAASDELEDAARAARRTQ